MKKKSTIQDEITIPITPQDLPIEELKKLIDSNCIQEELPFELLAIHYPSLLEEWYPGYPAVPRMMTQEDPICCQGVIEKGMLAIKDIPGLENSSVPIEGNPPLEGEYEVWLKKSEDGAWFIHVVVEDQ